MAARRTCAHVYVDERTCGAAPQRGKRLCYFHDPEKSAEAEEARRLGGMRRRKERTVAIAYDVSGLASIGDIRRLLEIAAFDALSMENSPARVRLLVNTASEATRLLEAEREAALNAPWEDD
jgi:hypothetical protein